MSDKHAQLVRLRTCVVLSKILPEAAGDPRKSILRENTMSESIEAKIAKIERALRRLKAEVSRRKSGRQGGARLISTDSGYDKDVVHRRKLRRRDLKGLGMQRLDEILNSINTSMSHMEPDGADGIWSTLKHNRDLVLEVKAARH